MEIRDVIFAAARDAGWSINGAEAVADIFALLLECEARDDARRAAFTICQAIRSCRIGFDEVRSIMENTPPITEAFRLALDASHPSAMRETVGAGFAFNEGFAVRACLLISTVDPKYLDWARNSRARRIAVRRFKDACADDIAKLTKAVGL